MMAKLARRSLAAHKLRLGLTTVAVVLGVAFVSGTLIFKDTTTRSFDDLFEQVYQELEVVVRGEQSFAASEDGSARPIPASVLATIEARVPAVQRVFGAAEGYAAIVGKDGKVIGSGWSRTSAATGATTRNPRCRSCRDAAPRRRTSSSSTRRQPRTVTFDRGTRCRS